MPFISGADPDPPGSENFYLSLSGAGPDQWDPDPALSWSIIRPLRRKNQ